MLADAPIYPTIPVTDKEKADAFYGGTLGFKPAVEDAGGTMYQAGDGTRFLVFLAGSPSSGDHTLVGWQVDDIEAEVAELKQRGVRFEEYDTETPGFGALKTVNSIADLGPIRTAWFKDPEGNILSIATIPGWR